MPGALSSAHGSIEKCNACHSRSGSGKLSWLRGLFDGDPHADSKACLTCHTMTDTAFKPHGVPAAILKQSTERLTKVAATTPLPTAASLQKALFPTDHVVAADLPCATCHQEHQGVGFALGKISNERCQSCHVVTFDSFDGHHPKFESYPFERRSRIIYDHAGHFGKHYPELAKKDATKRIPENCSSCHDSRADKRVMAVAPFEKTCSGCHLNQIIGKERVSGPKGIAFLSLPGIDVQTLKKKNAPLGEWPEASEAALTPFMKAMIARTDRGRAILAALDKQNLQDLAQATDAQVKAVTDLVWEIKALFHSLIKGKATDVLADLNLGGAGKLSAALLSDLTAGIPRDVISGAQQEWLPQLGKEMAGRPVASDGGKGGWSTTLTEPSPAEPKPPRAETNPAGTPGNPGTADAERDGGTSARPRSELPGAMRVGVLDADEVRRRDKGLRVAEEAGGEGQIKGRILLPSGTARSIDAEQKRASEKPNEREGGGSGGQARDKTPASPSVASPPTGQSDRKGAETSATPETATGTAAPKATGGGEQTDDLLFPTEEELRGIAAGGTGAKDAQPEGTGEKKDGPKEAASEPTSNASGDGSADARPARAEPQPSAPPSSGLESDLDSENWAEHGGWYRQDHAIFYRPVGHKDKFIYSWLALTGPHAPKGGNGVETAVFDVLTNKDAQGSCSKCHSIDDVAGKGRTVNFSPQSVANKSARFTNFVHEPHFGVVEGRGCLACHELEKNTAYLKSYEQGEPKTFASNFGSVKKELCQTCHAVNRARQDCLTCHKYHVPGAITPIMSTRIPAE